MRLGLFLLTLIQSQGIDWKLFLKLKKRRGQGYNRKGMCTFLHAFYCDSGLLSGEDRYVRDAIQTY